MSKHLKSATRSLLQGKIIAYPTESTWGLGVDARNELAVEALNKLKERPKNKSFIILIDKLEHIQAWIDWSKMPISIDPMQDWPGPITKVFPVSSACPEWLSYDKTVAIRISAYTITQELCAHFGRPLISTSANLSGSGPLRTQQEIMDHFGSAIDYCVEGEPGGIPPTPIINLLTGKKIR